ncbi:MAG: hypothetical protein M3N95_17915 [Actinomycetota bacterium]|nr:hypothetical protein [Actinomycetota bacterium]
MLERFHLRPWELDDFTRIEWVQLLSSMNAVAPTLREPRPQMTVAEYMAEREGTHGIQS